MTPKQLAEALLARKARGRSKFTATQERAILLAYLDGKSVAELAKLHGCCAAPINAIINRAIAAGIDDDQ